MIPVYMVRKYIVTLFTVWIETASLLQYVQRRYCYSISEFNENKGHMAVVL